jgi:flagellin-specific chaperone FliS
MSLMVHLPQYTELEHDYMGELALLKILSMLYDFPVGESEKHKAEKQYAEIDEVVKANRKLKSALAQLEASYDARAEDHKEDLPQLSSEVENFLKEMENRFGPG